MAMEHYGTKVVKDIMAQTTIAEAARDPPTRTIPARPGSDCRSSLEAY